MTGFCLIYQRLWTILELTSVKLPMHTQRTEAFFTFTSDELKHLTDIAQLENARGIFLSPSVDCMDITLQLQTNPILHNKLTNNQAKALSIAFHKQDMLVLIPRV